MVLSAFFLFCPESPEADGGAWIYMGLHFSNPASCNEAQCDAHVEWDDGSPFVYADLSPMLTRMNVYSGYKFVLRKTGERIAYASTDYSIVCKKDCDEPKYRSALSSYRL